ncbi:chromatin binding protein [Spiromyces aspiralis]|uniref:Chromatin binding protein n=1 Tax=Spiromyces aspiralis TaxID=68401 RepID=A0ACC1HNW1_9FUNG|nr:chromatin binding protein [Spiromyces aspiralis]
MNRQLLDPFELEYPEEIEACLDDEYATHCRFNRAGNYLATARSDGTCWIWDFETLSTIAKLRHGDRAITHVR